MRDKDDNLSYDPSAAAPSLFAGSAQRARADDPPGSKPPQPEATPAAVGRWLRTALRTLNIGNKPAAPADDAFAPAREPGDGSAG